MLRACDVSGGLFPTLRLQLQDELLRNRCPPKTLDVWRKGVDTGMFHPRHRSDAMRQRLSGGSPASPILVYVGRLGAGVQCSGASR